MTLKADAEYTLKGNTDVRLRFTEPMTTEVMDNLTTPVLVMMHSVFSKSTLVPHKASTSGRWCTRPPRSAPSSSPTPASSTSTTRSGRRTASRRRRSAARQGELGPAAAGGSVQLGRFTITPGSGVVMPQAARRRSWSNTRWAAGDGDEVKNETLVVYVADRDVGKEPDGVFYERAAELCIPGIETKDCTNIFESRRCSAI